MKVNRKRRRHWNTKRPQVLVLNKAMLPINVFDFEDSLTSWANGRARIIHTYSEVMIRSGRNLDGTRTVDMKCPSVITMVDCKPSEYNTIMVKTLPMNKRNIYERDKGKCVYCGRKMTIEECTIDHVYPKDLGGLNDWMNVRAACTMCNGKKDNKTLTELGWKLKTRVSVPTLSSEAPKNIIHHIGGRIPHESWRSYIYWEVKTKEKVREDVDYIKWEDQDVAI